MNIFDLDYGCSGGRACFYPEEAPNCPFKCNICQKRLV